MEQTSLFDDPKKIGINSPDETNGIDIQASVAYISTVTGIDLTEDKYVGVYSGALKNIEVDVFAGTYQHGEKAGKPCIAVNIWDRKNEEGVGGLKDSTVEVVETINKWLGRSKDARSL